MRYCKSIHWLCLLIPLLLALSSCATTSQENSSPPDMVKIPKGTFVMGFNDGEFNERPEHEVYLNTYYVDKYEVSAQKFSEFLNSQGNPEDKYFSHDQYSTIIGVSYTDGNAVENKKNPEKYIPRKGFEKYPANNVSWFGADAYCRWTGKRLPTEAEWEKAARSDDKRLYPWGNTAPDASRARINQKWEKNGFYVMLPVDLLQEGSSPYGVQNMAGNVWEWISDWYRQNYCDYCTPDSRYHDLVSRLKGEKQASAVNERGDENEELPSVPDDNPQGPTDGFFKILRGGSWYDSYGDLIARATYRYWFHPEERYLHVGFRCVKQ